MAKYVTNKDLRRMLKEANEKDRVTEELGAAFILISERASTRPSYYSYPYRDDMVGDAILNMCKYWRNIEYTDEANPFAYLTQITNTSFIAFIQKQQKQSIIQDETLIEYGFQPSDSYDKNKESQEKRLAKSRKSNEKK